ncbi:MHC class II transactivator isoform X1 [Pygocentrus nattereri]|uniref:NACHT domain-containing protein n=1 Tax=Pygocentrus nattereri TaxID=42514 RepID=A0A3B4DSN4_PYGNA|nr:MHC class II transactivator isoform X1 [Pygocentrus nattereri]
MVPFQEVLFEVRKVLQDAHPDLLPAFLCQLLEAQVFSAQYFQSLFQCVDPDLGDLTDVEDLARRLALPIWQKWDVSKEILFSALGDTEESQPDISAVNEDPIALDPQLLELIPESLLQDLISCDFPTDLDLDALCAELKEDHDQGEAAECPAPASTESEKEKRPRRKRPAGERAPRKVPRLKRRKTAPLCTESPHLKDKSHVSDVSPPLLPQLVHVPLTIATALNSASLLPSSGAPALQIIQTINHLSPTVINSLVPVGPTYVLVSPQSVRPVPQLVPLSPADGAVAPAELSRTIIPMSSLSDSTSRSQPPSPVTPISPTKDKTTQEDSPPTTPQCPVIPERVEDYIQQLKSHLRETCSLMQGGLKMDSHYIDTQLVQRKLVIRTGKNANKCLEKELVVLLDSERKKATVDRSHVFQNCGPKPKRLITVLGKAGTGKSTLIQRLALDWAAGSLPQFQFVFLVNCKVLNLTSPNYSFKTLLFGLSTTPGCDEAVSEAVFKHVLSNPDKVLLVFDSFDDIGDLEGLLQSFATSVTDSGYSVRQLFSGLFQKKILSGCTLLIASRPKDVLNQLLRKVDSILELCSFSPKDVELYTSNYFADASKQESVLRKIQSQKYIFSLCSNPLLCQFTCFLMEHQDSDGYTLPSTLTDLCQRVLDQHLELTAKEQGSKQDITELCNLAWEGFKTYSSLLSQDQEIFKELLDCGINCEILTSHTVCEESGKSQVTYFASLFMQNLLGALLLVQSKDVNDRMLVAQTVLHHRKRKVLGEWQDVLQRFVIGSLYQKATPHCCGIPQNSSDAQAKRKAVEAHLKNLNPGELIPSRLLELFHCIYEASNAKLAKLLVKNLPDILSFCGAHLTMTDVYVVWHLLQHAKGLKRTFSIDMQDTCVPLSGLKELVALDCVTSFRAPTMDTIDLWEDLHRSSDELSLKNAIEKFTIDPFKASQVGHIENLVLLVQIHREKKLPMSDAEAALEDGIPAVRHLHKLDYELGQQNGPGAFHKLTGILPALQSLQHLDLENNKIGDREAEELAGVLHSLSSLKMLNLSQNCIGDAGVEKLAQALSAASSLQSLSLYGNLIADSGAENLASVLPAMKSLLDLDVKYNKFTDVGAKKLSAALKSSPSMKSLQMWNNCIPLGVFDHLRLQDPRIRAL